MSPLRTVSALRDHAVRVLSAAGIRHAEVDAELLLGHVLGLSRGQVQAKVVMDAALDASQYLAVIELIERRAAREPLQHITGRAPFRSLELAVGPGVFVPRPETESVAQLAIDALLAVPSPAPRGIDLGTGSGAIAIAMATEVPHARVFAVENSPRAFIWARQNARESGADNLRLIFADLADTPSALDGPDGDIEQLDGTLDVVVSNPPYIPLGAIPRDPEVRLHDPEAALYGGVDGLDVVRDVSARAAQLLHPGGVLIIEHGELQGAVMRALLAADGWRATATHRDLLGRDRTTTALR
ncbi:MAG: peptide chain release factor N(5)-glutamine methyltransferase [Actinomycetota bacterium]|nr:peptide chain release factor N(5)-glutamine methyltransferase [Actinomycetota bacterium]